MSFGIKSRYCKLSRKTPHVILGAEGEGAGEIQSKAAVPSIYNFVDHYKYFFIKVFKIFLVIIEHEGSLFKGLFY
jgi:hypothetical protein